MTAEVLAAQFWPTNAELIEDVARLGYIRKGDWVLDPTYGEGTWWKRWQPHVLIKHDRKLDGIDFRALPYMDETFDVVAYDPPYVSKGGRKTTTMPEFQDRYGMTDAPPSPALLQLLINQGLWECARVLDRKGILLVKCQDYISSGKFWPGVYYTQAWAEQIGLDVEDLFLFLAEDPRPQPEGRRQIHARRNVSTLLVLRKAGNGIWRPRPARDHEALPEAGRADSSELSRITQCGLGLGLDEEERCAIPPLPDREQVHGLSQELLDQGQGAT